MKKYFNNCSGSTYKYVYYNINPHQRFTPENQDNIG